jgi:hypothetical protein
MELFVIGKAARLRSFPMNFQPKRDLDVRYAHNKIAWMTGAEFSRWIKGVNTETKRCDALAVCMQRCLQMQSHGLRPSDSCIDCLVRQLQKLCDVAGATATS